MRDNSTRPATFLPAAPASWSVQDLNELRTLAATGLSLAALAQRLRRSPSAIRNKASMHGISLRTMKTPEPASE